MCPSREQVPHGPEKGGQEGVQRGADLWARQGRWKNEGGDPTRREKTCKAAAGRDDDPGGCESLETFKPVKAVWLQVMGAHLNTEKDSGDSWDVLRHRDGWETGVENSPPGLPPGGFSSTNYGAAWSRQLPLESMTQPSLVLGPEGEGTELL